MRLRSLIFEDDETVRTLLRQVFLDRGYEVFAFGSPSLCPLNVNRVCECPLPCACGDVLLSDLRMPMVGGLEFVRAQRLKGCHLKFIALMSGCWSEDDLQLARLYDCKVFQKPFALSELYAWLDDCERQIDHSRCLADFHPSVFKNPPPPQPPGPASSI
jgi:CheY-like chemotaxis protein